MATSIRTALSAARARRIARHLRGVNFCDSCAQVSDSAAQATESRRDARLTAFAFAR
ncbi:MULTISPECIES: hypothetical protein [unclassified Streptomyces]|uniref:hypothetical protein n=1 Tax=unclassified Streptomyces TaxID=2593676 RepID=UPI000A913145|nr:hypothetical protein [Streptomyces sp. CB02058]